MIGEPPEPREHDARQGRRAPSSPPLRQDTLLWQRRCHGLARRAVQAAAPITRPSARYAAASPVAHPGGGGRGRLEDRPLRANQRNGGASGAATRHLPQVLAHRDGEEHLLPRGDGSIDPGTEREQQAGEDQRIVGGQALGMEPDRSCRSAPRRSAPDARPRARDRARPAPGSSSCRGSSRSGRTCVRALVPSEKSLELEARRRRQVELLDPDRAIVPLVLSHVAARRGIPPSSTTSARGRTEGGNSPGGSRTGRSCRPGRCRRADRGSRSRCVRSAPTPARPGPKVMRYTGELGVRAPAGRAVRAATAGAIEPSAASEPHARQPRASQRHVACRQRRTR